MPDRRMTKVWGAALHWSKVGPIRQTNPSYPFDARWVGCGSGIWVGSGVVPIYQVFPSHVCHMKHVKKIKKKKEWLVSTHNSQLTNTWYQTPCPNFPPRAGWRWARVFLAETFYDRLKFRTLFISHVFSSSVYRWICCNWIVRWKIYALYLVLWCFEWWC